MTTTTPDSGNVTGLPAYLQALQDKATRLEYLVSVIVLLEAEEKMTGPRSFLGEIATALAAEINHGLDRVNLPKGEI